MLKKPAIKQKGVGLWTFCCHGEEGKGNRTHLLFDLTPLMEVTQGLPINKGAALSVGHSASHQNHTAVFFWEQYTHLGNTRREGLGPRDALTLISDSNPLGSGLLCSLTVISVLDSSLETGLHGHAVSSCPPCVQGTLRVVVLCWWFCACLLGIC